MTKEQIYEAQLRQMGTWRDAFLPEIKDLAEMERELQRLKKRWRERGRPVEDKKDPLYPTICQLRRDILAHRNALGLTPASYKRMKGAAAAPEPADEEAPPKTVLALIRAKHAQA
ncbi:MAG: P27 family phage terminase small subunit [Oscillibacter sp.]|nr:P27 family phage terminase small subunit [Oscillibacter sp.]